ncbi:hypothetical protein ACFTZF_45800 [Streptomyces mirabilis]|uniref:hypothetical protein n=1 Tax=Streptomyces mirabilis TaxID=68239 RepID=UPI003641541E
MSGDAKDLQASGLGLIAEGITLALGELKELGMVGEAGAGRGFSDLSLSGLELGSEKLTSTFTSFCDRWEWRVRALIGEGNRFAEGVHLSAGTLHEADQYVEGSLKVAVNALGGNPHASEDEITRMSWGELAQHTATADPDYSKESFENAWATSKQGWKDASRDLMTSTTGPLGLQQLTGANDEQYQQLLDEALGPSAQERAEAAPQQAAPEGNAG